MLFLIPIDGMVKTVRIFMLYIQQMESKQEIYKENLLLL
jgi:hypothetical protein